MKDPIPGRVPAEPTNEVPGRRSSHGYGYGYGGYGYGYGYGYSASSSTRWPRFFRFLKRLWWVPLVTVGLGICAAAAKAVLEPPSYASRARLWVSGKLQIKETGYYSEELQFFFGTQVELLGSDKIRQAAAARVQTLHPGLAPCAVEIQASQAPKSAMFILRAIGDEPGYTQAYLDALIEEYLNYKKQIRAGSSDSTLASLSEQVYTHEKELKAEQDKLTAFQQENNLVVLQDQGTAAGTYLGKLNAQLSDLKLEDQFLEAMAMDCRTNSSTTNLLTAAVATSLSSSLPAPVLPAEQATARQQLQLLKLQRDELLPFLRPKHPKMQRLEEEIARSEKLLAGYRQLSLDQITPARQTLQLKMESVQALIQEWEAKLADANRRIAECERLKANVQRLQNVHERLLGLLQSVDMNKSLDQEIVSVMEKASPAFPTRTPPAKLFGLAAAGGLFAGLALVFLIARVDDRFTTLAELRDQFDEEIVGQVPEMGKGRRNGTLDLVELDDPRHIFAESYRNIRSSLLFMPVEGVRPKLLLVTSAVPNEGKTTVSANLARTMAFAGGRVLLVDGDLRKGRLHERFGVEGGKGLSGLLQEPGPLEEYVRPTALPNLFLLPSGPYLNQSTELFLSSPFDQLLKTFGERFDHVIIDSPPVFATDDAPTLAPKLDGVLFVVRGHFTKAGMARQALDILYQREATILGVVFNRAEVRSGSYYYYRYADYYHSRQEREG